MKMHKIWILTKVIIDKLLWYIISTDLYMYTSQAETAPPLTSNAKREHWEAKYVQHTELERVMDKLIGINRRIGLPLRRDCESQALSQFVCLSASALPWSRTFLMQPLISCLLILFHSLHPTCESTTWILVTSSQRLSHLHVARYHLYRLLTHPGFSREQNNMACPTFSPGLFSKADTECSSVMVQSQECSE